MEGRDGYDRLIGKQGEDMLVGDGGNDDLQGRRQADILAGGAGEDFLTGGRGRDVFIFTAGGGSDVVTDFRNERDRIDLIAFGFANFAEAASHFTARAADIGFTLGPDTLLIANFTLAQLDATDLIL